MGKSTTETAATSNHKKVVIAIGGNSLISINKPVSNQRKENHFDFTAIEETTKNIARIVLDGYRVVITHGNGPQVGDILIRSYLTRNYLPEITLDMANAITQSEIGYVLQHSLKNQLAKLKQDVTIATVVTQVLVDKNDKAFSSYTKPVGPFYTKKEAFELQKKHGWIMKEDAGRGYRRLVSSPKPIKIIEIEAILHMIEAGIVVIACGGGGIPVYQTNNGKLAPCAAVIDKDLTSALLAKLIDADIFLISTGVKYAYLYYNTPNQKILNNITLSQAKTYLKQGHFEVGSMKPKIEAAINFLSSTNKPDKQVIITDPKNIARALHNKKIGTHISIA
ncbi:MAG: carbamate kinase [candidate division WOR-3 bacterium]